MRVNVDTNRIEDALSHPLVRALLESTSDGVLVVGAKDQRVVAMNPVAREALDYREDVEVGCQCNRLLQNARGEETCAQECPLEVALSGAHELDEMRLYYRARGGARLLRARTRFVLVCGPGDEPLAGVELFRELHETKRLEERALERAEELELVGVSEAMRRLFELAEQVAPYDLPVLLTGESGVGKERFADALHHMSRRASGPLVKVNCAALAPTLIESELFGHARGAFTGASEERIGKFEEAHGGTLLLDEVGELALELQAKLLRVLQEGQIRRVGESRVREVDVRVIAATNRTLEKDAATGRFRQDLYFRLLGAHLHVPPLRERPEDIAPLARHFLQRFLRANPRPGAGGEVELTDEAMGELCARDWPGNARELRSAVELGAIMARAQGSDIEPRHLRRAGEPREEERWEETLELATLEARAIERAMERTEGNVTHAARLLGIDRTTLWRKLKRA